MTNKILLSTALLSIFSISSIAAAGTLHVVNDKTKDITVNIKPEGASLGFTLKQTIPAAKVDNQGNSAESTRFIFPIERGAIENKSVYSVTGSVGTIGFLSGTCENLSVDKDYTITFTDDKVGTSCKAESGLVK